MVGWPPMQGCPRQCCVAEGYQRQPTDHFFFFCAPPSIQPSMTFSIKWQNHPEARKSNMIEYHEHQSNLGVTDWHMAAMTSGSTANSLLGSALARRFASFQVLQGARAAWAAPGSPHQLAWWPHPTAPTSTTGGTGSMGMRCKLLPPFCGKHKARLHSCPEQGTACPHSLT